MSKNIYKLEVIVATTTLFLLPLAFLPLFPNFFTTAKLIVLTVGTALLLLLKTIKMLVNKKLELNFSKFDFPLFLIALSYLLSGIMRTPNKMEAFFLPGTATLVLASFLFYFLTNQFKKTDKLTLKIFLALSGVFVSLISLLSMSKVLANVPNLPEYIKSTMFTTLGGNLSVAVFLGIVLVLSVGVLKHQKDILSKASFSVLVGIVTLGLLANIYVILPGKPAAPKFASTGIYWSVAVDSMKVSPILGIGSGNYVTAFNRFRPIEYNTTELWDIKFASAKSFLLTMMTEAGLLAATGFILIMILVWRQFSDNFSQMREGKWKVAENADIASVITAVILLSLFPSTPTLVMIFFLVFSFAAKPTKITLHLSAQKPDEKVQNAIAERVPAILVAIPILTLLFFYGYYAVTTVSAESTYKKSLDALAQNDGQKTYELMQSAIARNPSVDRYHASLSQVTFAIANSISANAQENKTELTDEQKQTVSTLIQQSINEAKTAVSFNPARAGNWEILGGIYRDVMSFADGADEFAIQAYSQAVALNPISPIPRVSLGGIYYALGNYDSAIDVFKVAVIAKPDFANARYNLAIAYREKGETEKAKLEMTNVLSLLETDSKDYELVQKELEELEEKVEKAQEEKLEGEELTTPAIPEPQEPQIDLPEEAAPPEPEVPAEETPEAEPTPEVSPTPTPEAV